MSVHGLLLAAGAGTRMGGPKALVHDADGSWLRRAVAVLRDGGCDAVTVVLGAGADRARELLADVDARVVVAEDWAEGMGASLRAGLADLADLAQGDAEAAVVTLVDLPDLTPDVLARLLAAGADRTTLARAAYDGVPGHPVVLGRGHWAGVRESATGDRGARDYLAGREVRLVECGDLASGADRDTPGPRDPAAT